MKGVRVALISLFGAILLAVIIFLALAFLPVSRIEEIRFEGVCSYSIKSTVSKNLFSSYWLCPKGRIWKEIVNKGYISKIESTFSDNTLILNCIGVDDGVVITDFESAYFYSDGIYHEIDSRDVEGLRKEYLVVDMESVYLEYLLRYGNTSELKDLMDVLAGLDCPLSLITRAYFDNNNADGTICIVLQFDSLSSDLVISDLRRLEYLPACILAISKENNSFRYDTIFSETHYELKSYGLVRYKR